jgi:hypothetical protein
MTMGFLYKSFEKACYKGIHEANKEGIRQLREQVAEGNMTKEYFNNFVYGANDKEEIRKKRKNIW